MAKKIRFPLEMADGAQVRNLEDLREHFDLTTVLEYYKNGKLLTWLQDRYFDGEAAAVQALDETAPDLQPKLCEIFGAAYTGEAVDLEEISRRQERLERLRTFTDEAEFIDHIDQVAFDQEELADLLDEDVTTIYLCGEKFTVPISRKGMTYIGINSPSVHISGKLPETANELDIEFVTCIVDNLKSTQSELIRALKAVKAAKADDAIAKEPDDVQSAAQHEESSKSEGSPFKELVDMMEGMFTPYIKK